jgi:hypothetical protein
LLYIDRGNGIILEYGTEIGNAFHGNLIVFIRPSSSGASEDFAPAAFWVRN